MKISDYNLYIHRPFLSTILKQDTHAGDSRKSSPFSDLGMDELEKSGLVQPLIGPGYGGPSTITTEIFPRVIIQVP